MFFIKQENECLYEERWRFFMSKVKKVYRIPCVWQVIGTMEIEAESLEEAKRIAIEEAELPEKIDYLEDSFELDEDAYDFGEVIDVILPKRIKIAKSTDPNTWYADKIGQEFNVLGIWEDSEDHFHVYYYGEHYDEEALLKEYGSLDNPEIPTELLAVEHAVLIDDCEVVE